VPGEGHGVAEAVSGVVDQIDNGVARVLIGEAAEEWFYPLSMLPRGVEVGTCVWFRQQDGRWQSMGLASEAPTATVRTIEDRLERQRNRRSLELTYNADGELIVAHEA
jgi:hypothetical protein